MAHKSWKRWVIAFLAGGMPLATVATCDQTDTGQRFFFNSNDDNLIEEIIDDIFD
ncbi:MAG: hypothetical protein IH988_03940 [Planctomycetes bacterium]|nr:hypothetical protein [Planctomycetota bacterium]